MAVFNTVVLPACIILLAGFVPAFVIWKLTLQAKPLFHKGPSRWKGFHKKTPFEFQLEKASVFFAKAEYPLAERGYRSLLLAALGDVGIHLKLADCLFEQSAKGLRKFPEKRAEALEQYRWVLDDYTGQNDLVQAEGLYHRLLGPYNASEIEPDLVERFPGLVQGEWRISH